jgi:pyruvate/2-oxoglutarate dehydrogenase complex dihydrolipoamide dehydrogenase (E3) component
MSAPSAAPNWVWKKRLVGGRDTPPMAPCSNIGCILSKAMLHATEMLHRGHTTLQDGPEGTPSVD